MKSSNYYIATLKEVPSEAQLPSHQLMLKAGLIRKISSGLYSWMPIGLKIIRKIEAIIRDEMDKSGALEVLMPTIQPAELWKETMRWQHYGKELLRMKDRHDREFCYGPTHEEIITDIVRYEINSYKQLPVIFYQIQHKFRDEIRPRFGVIRSREFIMKDAYSFHENKDSLRETYHKMHQTYTNIFTRLGLKFRAVEADNGSIGGSGSHEFQVIAKNGEDTIVYSTESDYAANIELAPSIRSNIPRNSVQESLTLVHTPNIKTIRDLVDYLKIDIKKTIKSIVLDGDDGLVLLLIRGDDTLNEIKASKLQGIKPPLTFAQSDMIKKVFGASGGSLGPVGFIGKVYADFSLESECDWVVGSNQDDYHYTGFNFGIDTVEPEFVDIRNVVNGDPSPDGIGTLKLTKGIEVGHIFELGNKYSQAMKATFLDKKGTTQTLEMGCYGIGVTRIVAAAIEQNHDEQGIIWTRSMAPFDVIIVPMNYYKNKTVRDISDTIYLELRQQGIDVLLDDRNERIGVLLNDSELLGIPHRITVGERRLKENLLEYRNRIKKDTITIKVDEAIYYLCHVLNHTSIE